MKIDVKDPPRSFTVTGANSTVTLHDCAHISLASDEQVTFRTDTGAEYDVARKSWGFYATPSLNGRLKGFGLRGALVRARTGRFYVMLVEAGKEGDFFAYLDDDLQSLVCWLDDDRQLECIADAFGAATP